MLWYLLGTALFLVGGCTGFLLFRAPGRRIPLEEQLANLKRTVEQRDLDWVDMRGRCKRLLDRTEKAAAKLAPDVQSEQTEPTNSEVSGAASQISGRVLTPHQMTVQQSILRRRAGM